MFRPTNGTSVVVIVVALTTAGRETSGVSYHRLACESNVPISGDALPHLALSFTIIFTIVSAFLLFFFFFSQALPLRKRRRDGQSRVLGRLRRAFCRAKKCQDIPRRSASRTILATAFKPVGHLEDASSKTCRSCEVALIVMIYQQQSQKDTRTMLSRAYTLVNENIAD